MVQCFAVVQTTRRKTTSLLLLDRPSSAVLFLFSSLLVHVDDKLGDHGAG